MKITLCGSTAFYDEMQRLQRQLEGLGHEVRAPLSEIVDENGAKLTVQEFDALRRGAATGDVRIANLKERAIHAHFEKVAWADAILVTNYTKHDTEYYIGGNTLMEMGLALHLRKPIYLLNPIPVLSYSDEIRGMKPVVLEGDLGRIAA